MLPHQSATQLFVSQSRSWVKVSITPACARHKVDSHKSLITLLSRVLIDADDDDLGNVPIHNLVWEARLIIYKELLRPIALRHRQATSLHMFPCRPWGGVSFHPCSRKDMTVLNYGGSIVSHRRITSHPCRNALIYNSVWEVRYDYFVTCFSYLFSSKDRAVK